MLGVLAPSVLTVRASLTQTGSSREIVTVMTDLLLWVEIPAEMLLHRIPMDVDPPAVHPSGDIAIAGIAHSPVEIAWPQRRQFLYRGHAALSAAFFARIVALVRSLWAE